MNTALPPTRDVPPRRHAEIRSRLEVEVERGRRTVRFAPLVAAGVATAAVVALVAVVGPWRDTTSDVATGPSDATGMPTTAPPKTYSTAERPVFPDLSPQRVAEVETGCLKSAGIGGKAVLHQYFTDEIGTFALLYTDNDTGDVHDNAALDCTVDGPTMPFNSGSVRGFQPEWLPGEFAADIIGSASGGDGGKPEHAGRLGYDLAAGRVTAKVARVTFTQDGRTVEARIANGTFVARIPHPSGWVAPENRGPADIRAYDKDGTLLGTLDTISPERCYVRPDYVVVAGNRNADRTTCWPAVLWRR
ncbi:MAG: hypothetical protein HOV94_00920 [Saccharothrix sp.]|nr:hypothetical protein [Saccharothrix sp.]